MPLAVAAPGPFGSTRLTYRLEWLDDPQISADWYACEVVLEIDGGAKLPVDLFRLQRDNRPEYARIAGMIRGQHPGKSIWV